MKPKRLFNDGFGEQINLDGCKFSSEFTKLIGPFVKAWIKKGYSHRDMINIAHDDVTMSLIRLRVEERKNK